jgi:hypothetical protein
LFFSQFLLGKRLQLRIGLENFANLFVRVEAFAHRFKTAAPGALI